MSHTTCPLFSGYITIRFGYYIHYNRHYNTQWCLCFCLYVCVWMPQTLWEISVWIGETVQQFNSSSFIFSIIIHSFIHSFIFNIQDIIYNIIFSSIINSIQIHMTCLASVTKGELTFNNHNNNKYNTTLASMLTLTVNRTINL